MTSTLNLGSKIPISEIEGDITDASTMTGFLDDDLTKLSQAGKEAVFNGITVDLSSGVSISNNGAMPFDGWAMITAQAWSNTSQETHMSYAYINGKQVVMGGCNSAGSTVYNTVYIPVKTGDVFTTKKGGSGGQLANCILYPYKNSQEEAA